MGQDDKLFIKILCGTKDKSVSFDELCLALKKLGFMQRINGSHHIFCKDGIEDILNIQPDGAKAKPYQVKQVRKIILKYKLGGDINV